MRGDLDGANRGNALSPTGKFLRVGFIAVVDDTRTADTFLNIGATYPNQTFHRLDPARITSFEIGAAVRHRR
jgi:hypothetical protein